MYRIDTEKVNNEEPPYIYKWRNKNKERYLEISRAGSAKYYETNKEKKKAYLQVSIWSWSL